MKNDCNIDNVVVITGAGALTSPIKHLKRHSLRFERTSIYDYI